MMLKRKHTDSKENLCYFTCIDFLIKRGRYNGKYGSHGKRVRLCICLFSKFKPLSRVSWLFQSTSELDSNVSVFVQIVNDFFGK